MKMILLFYDFIVSTFLLLLSGLLALNLICKILSQTFTQEDKNLYFEEDLI